ncbi:MAG: CotH kinase family protein [Ruminococcus sp.]|nr:CotH kinase family protein [Ruminococcus sp.]
MKTCKKSVSILLALIMTVSLICAVPVSTNAAGKTADVDNGIPVFNITIDETAVGYSTIEQMNSSPDHSAECTGTIKLDVPDGYKGDYSDIALSGTEDLELEYIRGRGHTTWMEDKKPYKLKLKKGADLLGMGSNKHWILLANAKDETLLRNRIVYHIGRALGLAYTPKMLPVDVVMNGKYIGSYYLCEQVRVGKRRVNIDELTAEDNSEPEITGGYLFSLLEGDEDEQNVFYTENGVGFTFSNPAFYSDDPTDELGTDAQKAYITDYLQKIENAVYGKDFKDENGVSVWDYMDLQSTADYWWVQEFSRNVDAFRTDSTYLYKPRGDKVYWGPLWDFDLSLGKSVSGFDGFYMSNYLTWLNKLRDECPEYQQMLRERWSAVNSIITDIVKKDGLLDKYIAETKSSWEADNQIWGNDNECDFDYHINELREWLKSRQEWINENLESKLTKVYNTVKFVADGKTVKEYTVLGGRTVPAVPDAPAKKGYIFDEWQNEDGSAFESNYPILDDTTIKAAYVNEKDVIKAENIYFMSNDIWDDLLWPQVYVSYTITPFNANEKVAGWSSSDPNVAEVDSKGNVTKKNIGTTKITATLKSGLKKSFNLHVYDYATTEPKEIKKLTAAKSSITLKEGQYGHVDITASPQPCEIFYYFESSNVKVAEVDSNGVVHALKEGTSTITVTSSNGKAVKYKVIVKSTKKANTLKVTKKTKSIKAKLLKTKARTVKPLTISKAKGTVTVKTTSVKLGKKKISVKKFKFTKSGRLTVKKGKYKKGTYKVKVKITAKGNSNYKSKTINKTISIKIK